MGTAIISHNLIAKRMEFFSPGTYNMVIPAGGIPGAHARQHGAADPVGTFVGTFDGVHAGDEIRVYLPDGTEIAGVESCDADHALTWARYLAGSPNNTVTIHIISTVYENIELTYDTPTTNASIPIQQRRQRFTSY